MSETARPKKKRRGSVVSNGMDKSIVVVVERKVKHKLYGKYIRLHKKYMAHDPSNECRVGDKVLIEECRPISKNKRWLLRSIIDRAE